MASKYKISTEAQVLLKLLRIALGTEPLKEDGTLVEPFPERVNWGQVKRLSLEQNVSALAADGLNASGFIIPATAISDFWINEVLNAEINYKHYLKVLTSLCQIFVSNGLKPIILKGYGLSLDYPIPSHRGVGDIDVFLIDENGNPAAEKGDELIQKLFGISRNQDNFDLHSQFSFKGILVENHYALVGHSWNLSDRGCLNSMLENLIKKDIVEKNNIFFPSPSFNVVYLLIHMYNHYMQNRFTLRQFCDFALFLKKYGEDVDWEKIKSFCKENNLMNFASGIKTLLKKYLNNAGCINVLEDNYEWSDHILFDTFYFQIKRRTIKGKLTMYVDNPWHCQKIKKKNYLYLTVKDVMSQLKNLYSHMFGR